MGTSKKKVLKFSTNKTKATPVKTVVKKTKPVIASDQKKETLDKPKAQGPAVIGHQVLLTRIVVQSTKHFTFDEIMNMAHLQIIDKEEAKYLLFRNEYVPNDEPKKTYAEVHDEESVDSNCEAPAPNNEIHPVSFVQEGHSDPVSEKVESLGTFREEPVEAKVYDEAHWDDKGNYVGPQH